MTVILPGVAQGPGDALLHLRNMAALEQVIEPGTTRIEDALADPEAKRGGVEEIVRRGRVRPSGLLTFGVVLVDLLLIAMLALE